MHGAAFTGPEIGMSETSSAVILKDSVERGGHRLFRALGHIKSRTDMLKFCPKTAAPP